MYIIQYPTDRTGVVFVAGRRLTFDGGYAVTSSRVVAAAARARGWTVVEDHDDTDPAEHMDPRVVVGAPLPVVDGPDVPEDPHALNDQWDERGGS